MPPESPTRFPEEPLEQRALSQHDDKRRALVTSLAEMLASRPRRLAEPAAVREKARAKLDDAIATVRHLTNDLIVADQKVLDLECGLDSKENSIRSQLRDIAPACLEGTWRNLHWLELRVRAAVEVWSRTTYNAVGHVDRRGVSNLDAVVLAQRWLATSKAEVEAMAYDALPGADAAKRCAELMQEAHTKAATVLDAAAIAEILEK